MDISRLNNQLKLWFQTIQMHLHTDDTASQQFGIQYLDWGFDTDAGLHVIVIDRKNPVTSSEETKPMFTF